MDYFLTTQVSHAPPLAWVLTSSSFPSDHTPLLLTVPTITPPEPPTATVTAGRILTPAELSPFVQARFQVAFMDHLDPTATKNLEDAYASFSTPPRRPLYRKFFREGQLSRIEPAFVAGISSPPELHGLIGMDQFCQRHLAPPLTLSKQDVQQYMQWPVVSVPDLIVTVPQIRGILSQTSHTSPYHDRLQYKSLCFLSDDQLNFLRTLYNRWYQGEHLHTIYKRRLLCQTKQEATRPHCKCHTVAQFYHYPESLFSMFKIFLDAHFVCRTGNSTAAVCTVR